MAVNLMLMGPPGAGKGTQARRLARGFRVPHIATGDILREAVEAGNALGRAAAAIMDAGQLVGDDIVIGIVRHRLQRPDAATGFVLDGFPRTVTQAEALDAMLGRRSPLVVIDIAVDDEAIIRRLSTRRVCSACGTIVGAKDGIPPPACPDCKGALIQRRDDRESVVRERLGVYRERTAPLIDYYRDRPTFRSVDGGLSEDEVAAAVADAAHGRSVVRRTA
jgi:adenylate kinase